jgi:hypothetical protein
MDTKYVIFVFISTFLLAAIYSSTPTYYVSAAKSNSCSSSKTSNGKFLIIECCDIETDDETGAVLSAICEKRVCAARGSPICAFVQKG